MTSRVGEIFQRIWELEDELERALAETRDDWHYRLDATKIRFEQDIHAAHRRLKQSVPRFIRKGRVRHLLTAPVIYSAIVPIALIDVWLTLYQTICFPVYGIPRVPRSRFLVVDRHHLAYLNGIEKLNCVYCGYANGMFAYLREVATLPLPALLRLRRR
ncbi:MAG: hypothetical protein QGG24_09435 [Vicinamibacterales bacterium]|jgi:hypothetical protein|nr:hypothetical protein [Vicinamibacterales bacterium]MDP7471504.1 hypothetical protein [Vicinamibacterales bacterium]MDP7673097.1 hypothetical protein [Vicinamibacterales bacterium]HJO37461.1 hypothetical protein [Vicinamibacterales bacterium]|tara:strand:+ start:454 stop:930 length:477 start_codon:yes stop_codon:yes gene_type:complete